MSNERLTGGLGVGLEPVVGHEPRPAKLLRLLATAQLGVPCATPLPAALDDCRQRHALSMAEFTALLGMQRTHMSDVMNGKRHLPIGATRRAYALGIPADVLLQEPNAN